MAINNGWIDGIFTIRSHEEDTMKRMLLANFLVFFYTILLIAQDVVLGPPEIVSDPGVPIYPWCPDGHITYINRGDFNTMYWAGANTYRTTGADVMSMDSVEILSLLPGQIQEFDNGGCWLMSVIRIDEDTLIGFYHAEDHFFLGDTTNHFVAWKSIALALSCDNGCTWTKMGQIIRSSTPKPYFPTWGGNGDHCVVWDSTNNRWTCFYQEHFLCMAISYDRYARPNTWFKYYHGAFSEPGIDGRNDPIPDLQGHAGANPSVHFNTYLRKWVMVWHTWIGQSTNPMSVWLSISEDLAQWNPPRLLLESNGSDRYWYPTIIGTSDLLADEYAYIYYAHFQNSTSSERQFVRRSIQFISSESTEYSWCILPKVLDCTPFFGHGIQVV